MAQVVKAEIIGKRRLSGDTLAIKFKAPTIATEAGPGQFVMIRPSQLTGGCDPITPRPYSIFSLLFEDGNPVGFSLVIKVLGKGGEAISRREFGSEIQVTGPLGNHLEIREDRHYIMVAGGTGIAPVAFAAQAMSSREIGHTVLYGGRSANDLFLDELENFGLKALHATEDGSSGHVGVVTDLLETILQGSGNNPIVFACGPWEMMRCATEIATAANVDCHCSLERYMACGFGVCLSCVYRKTTDDLYHTCCQEGPVVDGTEVDWNA